MTPLLDLAPAGSPEFHTDPVTTGSPLHPAGVPTTWRSRHAGWWTEWSSTGTVEDEPWSIGITTVPERAEAVLDRVAAACVALDVPFRHVQSTAIARALTARSAPRELAGMFCAAQPGDTATLRRLLARLATDLAAEHGPHLLTHRRYRDTVVQYRLPDGVPDPLTSTSAPPPAHGEHVLNGRYRVTAACGHTASGGIYLATDLTTGLPVLVKEARAHIGFDADGRSARQRLRHEYRMLQRVHAAAPRICPAPVDYFTAWEHEFLVRESVPGQPLLLWCAANSVLYRLSAPASERDAYLLRCARLVDTVRRDLKTLRDMGLCFGALDHTNVVVHDDRPRLVGFGDVTPLGETPLTGAFSPPPDCRPVPGADDYALSALAMFVLFPLHQPLVTDPAGRADLLRRDLGPVPAVLWDRAAKYYTCPVTDDALPSAEQLDTDPVHGLRRLAAGLTDGLLAVAAPDREDWLFPPPAEMSAADSHSLAHGTAGILYALRRAGAAVPPELVTRFRRDVLGATSTLPSGLQDGLAGIAVVLAELGDHDLAHHLAGKALRSPHASPGLWFGAAGTGLAALRVADVVGDTDLVARAADLAERVPSRDHGTAGLAEGRSGVALFLHELGRRTSDDRYTAQALDLLHDELASATRIGGELVFTDRGGRRIIYYLAAGSAGVATVLTKLAAATGDERCTSALPAVLSGCRALNSVRPGLYQGAASWAYAMATHAVHAGSQDDHATAVRIACGLTKYAIRRPQGLCVLGSLESRLCGDLADGSAGVLLALTHVLDGASDDTKSGS
ncbi:hypothetical protein [Actinophytocola sp. NPDC049390]|uniref:class III lanthionine synthetase LanKC N-terminal domain-containing protein n=1 Tax=Actinophytocola sp. NPDC049390 TaxID=3363894 RepID=UPI0037A2380F